MRPKQAKLIIRDAVSADVADLADVVIEPNNALFRGLVPDHCLDSLTKQESMANWQRFLDQQERSGGTFLLVAETDEGRVVGCAMGGPQEGEPPYQAELYVLNILPAYQRHGLGRRLVACTAARLAAAGMRSMLVRVLSMNPNRAFYERLGARFIREEPYDWDGVLMQESVYGWPSTAGLIGNSSAPS
jgi:ribosomal protein S18 acetylase RimI-like enzyme